MPEPEIPFLRKDCAGKKHFDIIGETIKEIYDIEKDDGELRKIISIPENQRGKFFDNLRKNYPVRREFFNTKIEVDDGNLKEKFQSLGFN
jgi:erythronate-4-phosphate dehydrogenase